MILGDVQHDKIYECKMTGDVLAPISVRDVIPTGVVGYNLDSKREVFIKKEHVARRMVRVIENMSEWRLHNGEATA